MRVPDPGQAAPVASRAMRQVLSWRFVAAIAALIVLALVVTFVFAREDTIAEIVETTDPTERQADVIALVLDTRGPGLRRSARTAAASVRSRWC